MTYDQAYEIIDTFNDLIFEGKEISDQLRFHLDEARTMLNELYNSFPEVVHFSQADDLPDLLLSEEEMDNEYPDYCYGEEDFI